MTNRFSKMLHTTADRMAKPVDNAYLACIRFTFGMLLAWLLLRFIWADIPRTMFIDPEFHFSYRWFEWISPPAGAGMYVLLFVLLICAVCIAIGLAYRVAIWVFFVGWTYFFLMEPAYYLNHFYMVGLLAFLLGVMPAHAAGSIDALLRPKLRATTAPAWTIWAIRAQIGIVYFFAGVTKLHPDWLSGDVLGTAIDSWTHAEAVFDMLGKENVVWMMSYGGLVLDLTIVPGLLWRRTRWLYVIVTGFFQLSNAMLFTIDIFPPMAFALTLSYFDPGWPRTLLQRLTVTSNAGTQSTRPQDPPKANAPVALTVVLGLFFAVQIVVPFRHLAYSGDHNWTEEGHQFSWNLMSRVKVGQIAFIATEPASGRNWRFDPGNYLNPRQVRSMATDPQLILQFARFVAARMRETGIDGVEVRAFSKVSLNGRPAQFFIDPERDLLAIRPWQRTSGWVMPLNPKSPRTD